MISPNEVYHTEQRLLDRCEDAQRLPTGECAPQPRQGRTRTFRTVAARLRRQQHEREILAPPPPLRSVPTLALLQAVARGEISPEAADRLLIAASGGQLSS